MIRFLQSCVVWFIILCYVLAAVASVWYELDILANAYNVFKKHGIGSALLVWFLGELIWLAYTGFLFGFVYIVGIGLGRLFGMSRHPEEPISTPP